MLKLLRYVCGFCYEEEEARAASAHLSKNEQLANNDQLGGEEGDSTKQLDQTLKEDPGPNRDEAKLEECVSEEESGNFVLLVLQVVESKCWSPGTILRVDSNGIALKDLLGCPIYKCCEHNTSCAVSYSAGLFTLTQISPPVYLKVTDPVRLPPQCSIVFGTTQINVYINDTQLRLQLESGKEFTFRNDEHFLIGHLVDCRVRIPEAARYQCKITYSEGWHLADGTGEKPSHLGTWLTSLSSFQLKDQTRFRFGQTEFRCVIESI